VLLSRFGGDLLSHVLRRSTIGATALNCRVRKGIGCFARAMTTKPRKKHNQRFAVQFFCQVVVYTCNLSFEVLLLLDQIKPIGQLVPVN
jgi:hypothetical protein